MKLDLTNEPLFGHARTVSVHETTMAFEHLTDAKYCLLTTYRRTGDNVGTPVWFVRDGDSILVCTDDPSGKIRRMRRDPRVDVAACSWRGRRLGPDEPGRRWPGVPEPASGVEWSVTT